MRKPRGCFLYRFKGHVLEMWLGVPDHPESELVLALDQTYIPDLIAALSSALRNK